MNTINAPLAMPNVNPHQMPFPCRSNVKPNTKARLNPINQNAMSEEYIGNLVSFNPRSAPKPINCHELKSCSRHHEYPCLIGEINVEKEQAQSK